MAFFPGLVFAEAGLQQENKNKKYAPGEDILSSSSYSSANERTTEESLPEKKFQVHGKLEFDYRTDRTPGGSGYSYLTALELKPAYYFDDHWHAQGRLTAYQAFISGIGIYERRILLDRAWVEGRFNNDTFVVRAGKLPAYEIDGIFDLNLSGVELVYGNKVHAVVGAGTVDLEKYGYWYQGDSAYQSISLNLAPESKWSCGVGYHHLCRAARLPYDNDWEPRQWDAAVWICKGEYRFDDIWAVNGFFARNTKVGWQENAGNLELTCRAADREVPGSWGAWLAYRHLGMNAALFPTYNSIYSGQRGWELGISFVPAKNLLVTGYFVRGWDLPVWGYEETDSQAVIGIMEYFF